MKRESTTSRGWSFGCSRGWTRLGILAAIIVAAICLASCEPIPDEDAVRPDRPSTMKR